MADPRYITHSKWEGLTATELTFPNGRQVSSGYDALYRRNSVSETSGGASIAAWQFFGARTATVALGNGLTCSMMNNAGSNSAVQDPSPTNPAWSSGLSADRLGYDGSGRLIAKRFLPGGTTPALIGSTTSYDASSNKLFERMIQGDESRSALYPSYDSMDRLVEYKRGILSSGGGSIGTDISLPGTDSDRTYNLDGLGNWSTTVYTPEGGSSTTETRTHNPLNEITAFGVYPASTPVLYDHGNNTGTSFPNRGNGNIADDGTRTYAYDALNRLMTVNSKASGTPQVAAYTYDALGRRVEKVVTDGGIPGDIANTTYRYLYDGQQIVEEMLFDGSSYTTLRQFIWGQYIDELVQLYVPTTITTPLSLMAGTYYPLQDMLYRTTATTDSTGVIVEAYDYDAYGNTLVYGTAGGMGGTDWWADDAGTTPQPLCEFLFTGRQYDPETQIYWYRARYYQPMLGRFLGRDPAGFKAGINLYEYMDGDPLRGTDPLGLQATQPQSCCCCCVEEMENAQNFQQETIQGVFGGARIVVIFQMTAKLSYQTTTQDKKGDCKFEWWEWSSLTIDAMVKAKTWNDLYQFAPNSKTFKNWQERTKSCPGTDPVAIKDTPDLPLAPKLSQSQQIYFAVRISSAPSCACKHGFFIKYAEVNIVTKNGTVVTADWKKLQNLPNPPGKPPAQPPFQN